MMKLHSHPHWGPCRLSQHPSLGVSGQQTVQQMWGDFHVSQNDEDRRITSVKEILM